MYLLDTNVISELRKGTKANASVRAFFDEQHAEDLYLSAQTVGEIRCGVENVRRRGDREQALILEQWLDVLVTDFRERILDFDMACAQVWGKLMSPSPHHPIDKQIAAIALIRDLVVITRNPDDFYGLGARLHNPFS